MRKLLLAAALTLICQQAQAQEPAAPKPAWMEYKSPYAASGESDITNPHRTMEEIVTWGQQAAAEVLSFTPQNHAERLESFKKKYFAAQGWQQYADSLKKQKLLEAVTEDGYSMGTIVTTPPEIISQDASGGTYHWVVKAPLSVSFFSMGLNGSVRPGPSYPFVLFMNITRTGEGKESGLAINNWRLDPAPR